jgi:Gpi18-like mannosyltransferase
MARRGWVTTWSLTSARVTKDIVGIDAIRGPGHDVNPNKTQPESWRLAIAVAIGCGLVGLALRYVAREHATDDAIQHLIPWYVFARDHGVAGLAEAFTNYTPFYSYLLLIAARFDWLGEPLSLVKAISAVFELGCAITVAQIVWRATKLPLRASLAFCAVWLAPTVIFNGAVWAESDSIWTYFTLVSIALFMRDRNGVASFAMAFSVKAQGVFLGPFVLGMILRSRIHPAWLATVPGIYVVLAIPVLVAGRSLASVFAVYLDQAHTFNRLTMNAANIWVLAGGLPYAIGVAVGMVLAAASGLALSIFIARSRRAGPESIALACLNPRYVPFAVIAQVDGVLSYLAFENGIVLGVLPAALCNSLLVYYLVHDLWRGERGFRFPKLAWLGFIASSAGLFSYLVIEGPGLNISPLYLLATGLVTAAALLLLKESRGDLAGPDQLP